MNYQNMIFEMADIHVVQSPYASTIRARTIVVAVGEVIPNLFSKCETASHYGHQEQ